MGYDDFDPDAGSSSGFPISYFIDNEDVPGIVDKLHINGAGEMLITAMQEGNELYNAAPQVTQTLTVQGNTYTLDLSKHVLPYPIPEAAEAILEVPDR